NLQQAKALGVEDVAFHKKCRLAIEDMVKNRWVYRKLRNFRAGIEANISCLKRGIRVAALHLAGARALPLLCLGIGGGLQSRLVHHARSALKQQKSSSAPRAAPANASLRLPSSQQLA